MLAARRFSSRSLGQLSQSVTVEPFARIDGVAVPSLGKRCFAVVNNSRQQGHRQGFRKWLPYASAGALLAGGLALALQKDHFASEDGKKALSPKEFREFELQDRWSESHNADVFRFKLPHSDDSMGLTVASCIVVGADIEQKGETKFVTRPYTPISSTDEKGHFDLLIKKYPNGPMSSHVHSLKKGDKLKVKGPFAKIEYKPNMKKKIGMIAGGTGLTPMLQVIEEILKNPRDRTDVSLVFANVTQSDILLRRKLDDLARKHPNFHVYYTLDKPPHDWDGGVGYVSKDMIKSKCPPPSSDSLILVCGPDPMLHAIAGPKGKNWTQGPVGGLLKDIGYTEDMVYKF